MPQRSVGLMDALRSTLEQHPGIQLQEQQAELNKGALRVASGQFDTTFNAGVSHSRRDSPLTLGQQIQYEQLGLIAFALGSNTTTITFGQDKLFRNGISETTSVTLERLTDNLTTQLGLNQSEVSFQVVLPLLRGRGRAAVGAQEMSSESLVDASLHDTNQAIAQSLANTAISYWNAVAAVENLQIAKGSEERGAKYVQNVQILIGADKVPTGDINQLIANLAGRTASRIAAEQSLINAQQNLALAMGLRSEEIVISPDTSDPLPDWIEDSIPEVTARIIQRYVENARKKRPDLIAARLRENSAEQLLPAARNQLRPQLNVTLATGYSGLLEGTQWGKPFGALVNNVHGLNVYAALNFAFPPRNDVAIGQLTQAVASYQQSKLNDADLERNIASNVVTAVTTLSNSVAALQKSREAVEYYQVALDQEQEKFRMGLNSLVDVLTMEDRLTSALSQKVAAQLNYAVAIENLRLASGTIVDPNSRTQTIDKNAFLHPPLERDLN